MSALPLAIVGNGAAAAEAILALRAHGYDGEIHLFADNTHAPYNPMLGTYLVAGAIPLERAFPFGDERRFYGGNQVTAHSGQEVTALDPQRQTLVTADGRRYSYRLCLVASGARPAVPPVPGLREALAPAAGQCGPFGGGARRIFTVQSLEEILQLKEAVDNLRREINATRRKPRAVVLGASFAGVKVAEVLHEAGLRVSLVEREPIILPLSAHPLCAREMEAHLRAEGYDVRVGACVDGVEVGLSGVRVHFAASAEASPGLAASPELAAQTPGQRMTTEPEPLPPHLDADLLVVCTGTRPSLAFLAPGTVETDVGILVDEHLRSSVPTLYAAGDVAQGRNLLTGRHEIIGLWGNARYQGRAAGRNLAGLKTAFPGSIPHNITHVGQMLFASIGCLREYDRVETRTGDSDFEVWAWKAERLVGVNLLGSCLTAGVVKQAFLRMAVGAANEAEVTWIPWNV